MSAPDRTLIHEAGHAVIGYALDLGAPVEVLASGPAGGHTRGQGWGAPYVMRLSSADYRSYLEAEAVQSLAGEAALEVFGDSDPGNGASRDRDHARRTVAAMHDPSMTVAHFYRRAVELVRQHRDVIDRFASALAAHDGRLDGPEVAAALDRAFAGEGHTLATRPPTSQEFTDRLRAYNALAAR